jgi:AraC family ethanolamine operon transcriptional activator
MQQAPLQVRTVHLQDVDEQASMLPEWEQEYQQLGHGRFSGCLAYADIQDFVLIRETSNKALHESVMPPDEQMVIGMCLSAENSPAFNGKVFDQNSLLMIDGQRSHDIRTEGHLELIGIAVNRDYFFSRVQEQDTRIANDSLKATVTQLAPRAADMLRQYFIMVSDLLQHRDHAGVSLLTPRILANSAISNIALAVSLSRGDHYGDNMPKLQQRRDRIVQLAIDYMRKNACEEIGILDVCAATHVSRRTLQYCFEERLNISPLQYLKALRLNQARRQLKHLMELQVTHEHQNTIASVAALCGFNHASRFASDYKRMFGELPSQIKS